MSGRLETADPIEKVRQFLDQAGYQGTILYSRETIFTVEDASKAVGAPAEAILKSIVLRADGNFVLALMSGVNRVDLKAVRKLLSGVKKYPWQLRGPCSSSRASPSEGFLQSDSRFALKRSSTRTFSFRIQSGPPQERTTPSFPFPRKSSCG